RAHASMMLMTDADVVSVLEETAALARQVEQIQVAAAGVIALRSTREQGHAGLSASRGHRSAAALIQDVTGSTKADATRKVRVGEALLDGPAISVAQPTRDDRLAPWYQPLRDALREDRLTSAQFDAIRRGLGELPEIDPDAMDADARAQAADEVRDAWARAAEHLITEAPERTVEELWQQ